MCIQYYFWKSIQKTYFFLFVFVIRNTRIYGQKLFLFIQIIELFLVSCTGYTIIFYLSQKYFLFCFHMSLTQIAYCPNRIPNALGFLANCFARNVFFKFSHFSFLIKKIYDAQHTALYKKSMLERIIQNEFNISEHLPILKL